MRWTMCKLFMLIKEIIGLEISKYTHKVDLIGDIQLYGFFSI